MAPCPPGGTVPGGQLWSAERVGRDCSPVPQGTRAQARPVWGWEGLTRPGLSLLPDRALATEPRAPSQAGYQGPLQA